MIFYLYFVNKKVKFDYSIYVIKQQKSYIKIVEIFLIQWSTKIH